MARPKSIITKSQLAKELRLSKPRISQLITAGLPVRRDGRVNRDSAFRWYHANIAERPERTVPRKVVRPAPAEAEIQHQARLETVQAICSVCEVLEFARTMLRAGFPPKAAFVAAELHGIVATQAVDRHGWLTDRELESLECDPDNDACRAVLGQNFNFQKAEQSLGRATISDRASDASAEAVPADPVK
jgi:hypothetical protein